MSMKMVDRNTVRSGDKRLIRKDADCLFEKHFKYKIIIGRDYPAWTKALQRSR